MISLTGLRSFVAVVETGGVRAAADQIHRTPSAVSMTLKQLELDIGAPLFESERKSTLSDVGRAVLEEARGMLAHYERACAAMTTFAADRLGRCDIASVPSVAVTLLPRAIARVRQAEGLFDIHVRDIDSSAIIEAVENGVVEVGLCVLANKRPELTFEALFREPLDFVCRVDHPLTMKKGPLKWAQLEGCGLILNGSVSALGLPEVSKLAANSKLIASNVNSNLAMVEAGLGVTILPRMCRWQCSDQLRFLPLADAGVSRTVGWIAREGRAPQPATAKLLNCIRELTRECAKEFGYAPV
jgi:LysR family transcriptional regulator, carnitine catabolism transcriptional activator